MRRDKFLKLMEASYDRRTEISIRKSEDYASDVECLGNFKRCAQILSALFNYPFKPSDVAIIYSVLKIDRFCNLRHNSKTPSNEGLLDTIDDLKNYCDFIEAAFIEETKGEK